LGKNTNQRGSCRAAIVALGVTEVGNTHGTPEEGMGQAVQATRSGDARGLSFGCVSSPDSAVATLKMKMAIHLHSSWFVPRHPESLFLEQSSGAGIVKAVFLLQLGILNRIL
jgi:hypothetical protein